VRGFNLATMNTWFCGHGYEARLFHERRAIHKTLSMWSSGMRAKAKCLWRRMTARVDHIRDWALTIMAAGAF